MTEKIGLKNIDFESLKFEFAFIPPGSFKMGCPECKPEKRCSKKPHLVTIYKGFWIGVYSVTQLQWKSLMGQNPSGMDIGDGYPVERVSWNDCMIYIERLNHAMTMQNEPLQGKFRLPTEAEWEYACRAGSATTYYWGDEIDGDYCWHVYNSESKPQRPGGKKPNSWGLYDMIGNVWEWCSDRYFYNFEDPLNPKESPAGVIRRIIKGGAWFNSGNALHASYQCHYQADSCNSCIGFRLVMDI